MGQMTNEPVIRPTVRVLMLDEHDQVLLFRGQDPSKPNIRFWFPTGGGIEEDESPEDAARREVLEETGLRDFELGPHIWNRRHVFTFYGHEQDVREVWFLARVHNFEIDTSRFTELEREILQEHRWWSLNELETTTDVLTPRGLAKLLRTILKYGPPKEPVTVPV